MNIFQELKLDLINWSKFCIRLISKKGISMFAFCVAIVTGPTYFYLWDSKIILSIFLVSTIILLFKIGMFIQDSICELFKSLRAKIRRRKAKNEPYHINVSDKP